MLITMIDDNMGIVIDNDGPMYRIILDNPTNIYWEIARPRQKYQEIVYSRKLKLLFAYSYSELALIAMDITTNQFYKVFDCRCWGHVGKKLRLTKDELSVVLKTGEFQLTLLYCVDFDGYVKKVEISNIKGDREIADFRCFGPGYLMVVTYDGYLSLYAYTVGVSGSRMSRIGEITSTRLAKFKISLGEDENIISSCVCSREKYIAMSTFSGEFELRRLIFFEIEEISENSAKVKRVDNIDFRDKAISKKANSYISDLNMDLYFNEYPLLFAMQGDGDHALLSYYFDQRDQQLKVFRQMRVFNSGFCRGFMMEDNAIWSIDTNGLIKRIAYSSI